MLLDKFHFLQRLFTNWALNRHRVFAIRFHPEIGYDFLRDLFFPTQYQRLFTSTTEDVMVAAIQGVKGVERFF